MPNTVRCPNGHFYDLSKFQACPYCGALTVGGGMAPRPPMDATVPLQPPMPPMAPVQPMPPMQPGFYPPQGGMMPGIPMADEKTVSATGSLADINRQPVVGWLVCIGGPSLGRAYNIRENKNFIGRSPMMDIVIEGDNAVSREKHGIITYVPKQRMFLAQPGESRELFYVNDKVVLDNMELKAHDRIEIGKSLFLFVPLCGSEFSWDDIEKE